MRTDILLAALLSGSVGLSELLARYRSEPKRLLASLSAWTYIAFNALTGVGALAMIRAFDWTFGTESATSLDVVRILVAGFGSVALFRSSLFMIRVGGSEVGVGPNTVMTSLLHSVDRAIDRAQAKRRSAEVSQAMAGVIFAKSYETLPSYCLALMQNVSREDQEALAFEIVQLAKSRMADELKVLSLGLKLMNVVGSDVLHSAIRALGSRIKDSPVDAAGPHGSSNSLIRAQQAAIEAVRFLEQGNAVGLASGFAEGASATYVEHKVADPAAWAAWNDAIESFKSDWPTGAELINMGAQPAWLGSANQVTSQGPPAERRGSIEVLWTLVAPGRLREGENHEMRGRAIVLDDSFQEFTIHRRVVAEVDVRSS